MVQILRVVEVPITVEDQFIQLPAAELLTVSCRGMAGQATHFQLHYLEPQDAPEPLQTSRVKVVAPGTPVDPEVNDQEYIGDFFFDAGVSFARVYVTAGVGPE